MEKNLKIAVIGGGISGLGAAYLLNQNHQVYLYEKNDYVGGHTRSIDIAPFGEDKEITVDTGFIVFNHRNYPLLTPMLKHLGVESQPSDMSFSLSVDHGWLEYGTQSIRNIFAQKCNLFRPKYLAMLKDILKFNKQAPRYINAPSSITLKKCLDELGMGKWFRNYFLLPMGGSIWSCPISQIESFPASTFIRFFQNHGLLSVNDQPQWHTVKGGAKTYVEKITSSLDTQIRLGGVAKIKRTKDKVTVTDALGNEDIFDHVVIATHGDQALKILEKPTKEERSILSNFKYQKNEIYVHSDTLHMPKRSQAWASWSYVLKERHDENPQISLSYWMNRLQSLETQQPILVTLNPATPPAPHLTYDQYVFEHPIFDKNAIDVQEKIPSIQGTKNTWYCGAYQRYGFHEDGLWSAVRVAKELGCHLPW